jgi:uncharacterized membrane protein YfcA
VSPADAALLSGAGFVAGAVNAVAGGGSLLSFPALLAVGHGPLVANVTNTVGLLPGYLGGTVAYRRELAGQGARVRSLGAAAAVGALLGCALLLWTSEDVFEAVVPWLVLASCALLAVQPRLSRRLRARDGGDVRTRPVALHVAVGLAGAYASYFGAAVGVVLLAVLGLLVADRFQRLNALKGALSLVAGVAGAAVFVVVAPVDLAAAGVLAVSSLLGGRLGGGLARRVPDGVLRGTVLVVGTVVAVVLLL